MRALALALAAALVCGATLTASTAGAVTGRVSEGCREGIVHVGGLATGRGRAGPPCPATAARSVAPAARTPPRAPSGPPLVAPTAGGEAGEAGATEGDVAASAPASGGDPLVENGLGSPLCGEAGELAPASRRNCATSGFEAAGAPTGDYGLDVHIDTGPLDVIPDGEALVQDDVVEPVWMGLVWVVHTVVVALEWCFTLDLLDSSAMGAVERALSRTQASFTGPWLVLALALAGVAAAYNGLVRRRVAETLGQAALTLAMVAGGLWTIADPTGTVGALGRWADAAGTGTLGAVVDGTPAHAPRTLAQSMGGLFAAVVGAPWCYLEFGNVGWCEDPARLEPRLHVSALVIAGIAQGAHCASGEASPTLCRLLEGESPRALAQSAALLRAARTNGEVFLALPANGPARNSAQTAGTLLSVLCGGSEDATDCHGPTAAQAEFRTQSGTGARIAGLVLIAVGEAGVVVLLGFIVMHLLGAEVLSLLYLLLAPAAVVAPALGDGGRAAFRTWGTQLVDAVCSKLVFSFLLGVVLLLTRTLVELEAFGWWTRWLLLTVLWWSAYRQRHRTLGFIAGEHRGQSAHQRSLTQLVKRQLEGPRAAWRTAQWARGKLPGGRGPGPSVERRRTLERIGRHRAQATANEQVERMFEREHAVARAHAATALERQSELSAKRTQLQRVQGARAQAAAAGDTRRATELDVRAQRVEREVERGQLALNEARRTAGESERAQRRTGRAYTPEQARERNAWLDAQAALPAATDARGRVDVRAPRRSVGDRSQGGPARDYAGLASLVGYSREQYEGLGPRPQREARLEIDRELALRRELSGAASALAAAGEPSPGRRERCRAGRDFDRALEERLRQGGHAPPRPRTAGHAPQGPPRGGHPREGHPREGHPREGYLREGPAHEGHPHDARRHPPRHDPRGRAAGGGHGGNESSVMRDAREVARRRKRQLGGG